MTHPLSSASLPSVSAERAAHYRALGLWDTRLLRDGIEAAAARRPDAPAVADNEVRLSRQELSEAVRAAVGTLSARGVRTGDSVVLVSGNTRHGVIAYHGLLRMGALLTALDRRCGAADLRAALDALPGRPRVILPAAEADRFADLVGGDVSVPLELFDAPSPGSTPAPAADWAEPDRDRAAVVLFSSGTTGRPKGVVHSLNTLTAGADNMARITSADEDSVCFLVSPLTSITGLMQVHLAADHDAVLVLEDHFEPAATLRRLNDAGATLLGGAPVIAERLLRAAEQAGASAASGSAQGAEPAAASGPGAGSEQGSGSERGSEPGTGPAPGAPRITLQTLALGGAMLPRPLLDLADRAFGIGVARVYGSSEAPNFTGSLPGDDRETRLSDDGALMPGSEVRVGSSTHEREGLLRGPGVFLGYLDPEDNAAAFEDGWYRSGDQVELHDGRLTVVGRLKEIVNRNGLKISLTETDAALADFPGVLESSSFAVPDPETGERLAVAVLPVEGVSVTLDDVVTHLLALGVARRKLPEQLVRWDGPLPRTASGKIVRSRLVMEAPAKDSDVAPRLREPGSAGK